MPLTDAADFCILWNWEYDASFVDVLLNACRERGLSLLQITPDHLETAMHYLSQERLTFRALLDRASEADERFLPLVHWANSRHVRVFNRHQEALLSRDKGFLHYRLIEAGLHTPYTVLLPSYEDEADIPSASLEPLGTPFVAKPSDGSGGEGVTFDLYSWDQVLELRHRNPRYRYLLQTFIEPTRLNGRPAWFRVLFCCGQAFPCWWHPQTHLYSTVTAEEVSAFGLEELIRQVHVLAAVCGLDFFSTEIALTEDGPFVVVDYVNDQPDMRLQREAEDGVPDEVVEGAAAKLAAAVLELNR